MASLGDFTGSPYTMVPGTVVSNGSPPFGFNVPGWTKITINLPSDFSAYTSTPFAITVSTWGTDNEDFYLDNFQFEN
jgi:hypothetical protein